MTSNQMPTTINNQDNNQAAHAPYVSGTITAAPIHHYHDTYNVSIEAEADTAPTSNTTYHASTTIPEHIPLVNATYVGEDEQHKKDKVASSSPTSSSSQPHHKQPPYNTTGAPATASSSTTPTAAQYPLNGSETLTGNELLALLKQERKRRTVTSGVVGGVVGGILLGPIGAVALGWGQAAITKHTRKRQEKHLRAEFERQGTLDKPVVATAPLYFRRI